MAWSRVTTKYSIHRVQHTPSTAYTEYSMHWVLHTPRIASSQDRRYSCSQPVFSSLGRPWCSQFSTLPQLRVNQWIESQLPSRLPPELPPPAPPITPPIWLDYGLQLHLQTPLIIASKNISKLAGLRPPSASPNTLDHSLQVNLQTRSITASKYAPSRPSKCISKLARSQPRSASWTSLDYGLQVRTIMAFQVHLQTRSIMASECISKLARSRPPSLSPNSHDYGLDVHFPIRSIAAFKCISKLGRLWPPSSNDHVLQVHVQTRSTMALECISKFTWSWCGEALELEGRQPIIKTPPHVAWHPKGIREKERFWLEVRRERVTGCEWLPSHDEPHKLHGSMKDRQECMRPRAGKDRVCISYNEMSIYSGVFQINTSCHWVHHRYLCVSVCIYIERLRQYMPYYDVANLVTVTKMNMIDEMPCGMLRTTGVRIWHQVSRRACAEVSAALQVSCGPVLRSQLLSMCPADLCRGLSSSKIWLF